MATIWHCGCAAQTPPSQLVTVFHPYSPCSGPPQIPTKLSTNIFQSTLNFRIKDALRFQIGQRRFSVSASNSNSLGDDSTEQKSAGTKTSEAAQGPPFLTIFAGFLVFFLIIWIVGSIITFLISLIASLPPTK